MTHSRETYISQPVRSLQAMLRVISAGEGIPCPVIPDGIYGSQTAAAVSAFQRRAGLPVTGVTDEETWNAVVNACGPALVCVGPAQPLRIRSAPGQVIRREERSPTVHLVQAMLQVLSETYPGFPAPDRGGQMDSQTCGALAHFQGLCGLDRSGELDKITWKHLVLQYQLAAANC